MPTTTLSIRVDDEQKDRLEALAESTGRSRSFLAAEAIREYLDANEWQVAGVHAAVKSIEQEGGVSHDRVKAWAESWGGKSESERPGRRKA